MLALETVMPVNIGHLHKHSYTCIYTYMYIYSINMIIRTDALINEFYLLVCPKIAFYTDYYYTNNDNYYDNHDDNDNNEYLNSLKI